VLLVLVFFVVVDCWEVLLIVVFAFYVCYRVQHVQQWCIADCKLVSTYRELHLTGCVDTG